MVRDSRLWWEMVDHGRPPTLETTYFCQMALYIVFQEVQ